MLHEVLVPVGHAVRLVQQDDVDWLAQACLDACKSLRELLLEQWRAYDNDNVDWWTSQNPLLVHIDPMLSPSSTSIATLTGKLLNNVS